MLGTTVRVALVLLIALVTEKGAFSQQALPPEVIAYADTVLHNGKILTADDQFTIVQAVAIRDGKFLATGQDDRILKMAGPRTQKINLGGKTAVPGFLDTHMHLDDYAIRDMLLLGFAEENGIQWEGVNQRAALWWEDAAMALRDIGKAVKASQPGEWVYLIARTGWPYDWLSGLTMQELDAISPNNPVVICGNVGIESPRAVNSKALELAKIPAGMPGLPRDGSARISGRAANSFEESVLRWLIPIEEQIPWHKKRMQLANSWGLTLVETRILPSHFSALRELWLQEELTVRYRVAFPGPIDVTRVGNMSDIGDDFLKVTGVRGGGALGGAPMGGSIMTFSSPLNSLPGREGSAPRRGFSPEAREKLITVIQYGWSTPNTHINGDLGTAEFLKAIEEAVKNPIVKSSNQRLTMDHLMDVRPQEIQKMKELGVLPSISPWFLFTEQNIGNLEHLYGRDRMNDMMAIKSYINAGIKPSLEADGGWDPGGKPLYKIMKAITRKDDKYGRVWNEAEKVSRREALWMSTNWSAITVGDGDKLGSIESGKLADLVVLGRDYMTVPEDEISDIPIDLTIVGGKIVFDASTQERPTVPYGSPWLPNISYEVGSGQE